MKPLQFQQTAVRIYQLLFPALHDQAEQIPKKRILFISTTSEKDTEALVFEAHIMETIMNCYSTIICLPPCLVFVQSPSVCPILCCLVHNLTVSNPRKARHTISLRVPHNSSRNFPAPHLIFLTQELLAVSLLLCLVPTSSICVSFRSVVLCSSFGIIIIFLMSESFFLTMASKK